MHAAKTTSKAIIQLIMNKIPKATNIWGASQTAEKHQSDPLAGGTKMEPAADAALLDFIITTHVINPGVNGNEERQKLNLLNIYRAS